jgi:hypothetical protein
MSSSSGTVKRRNAIDYQARTFHSSIGSNVFFTTSTGGIVMLTLQNHGYHGVGIGTTLRWFFWSGILFGLLYMALG